MPSIKDLGSVTENAELIAIFKTAIRRQAWTFAVSQTATTAEKEWAARARFNFGDDRTQHYATLAIEGLLTMSPQFLALVEQYKDAPGAIDVPDSTFMAFVGQAVAVFVALGK